MIEKIILESLVFNERFSRQILHHIDREYFSQPGEQVIFKLISDHVSRYNAIPSIQSLEIDLNASKLVEGIYKQAASCLSSLTKPEVDYQWLVDNTEQFCKKQALYNAVSKSAAFLATDDSAQYGKMLDLVKGALSVTFDNNIGHDYIEDAESRADGYKKAKNKIRCDLESFNSVLRGGWLEKTLTVFLLPTGKGKSLILCHFAGAFLTLGFNVLYITLEMPEDQVGGRIDSNTLNIPMEDLSSIDKVSFMGKIKKLQKEHLGKLIIKEYPAHTAHSGHFRHLINELILKKNFKPDVIIVDYLGICKAASSGKDANSYERQKAVAEEIRGLGMEFNCRVFSAAQVNKEGTKAVDFGITDTAESWGVPATADYMFGGVINEELEKLGQMKINRLKDRHNDANKPSSFMIGIDRSRMRLFDIDAEEIAAATGVETQPEYSNANMDMGDVPEMVF